MAKQGVGKAQHALYVSFDPVETEEMDALCRPGTCGKTCRSREKQLSLTSVLP